MEIEELKSLIRQAFKEVVYPGDNNIAGCSRSLTPNGCDDCDGLAAHFEGTTWQEHNPQTLIGCDSAPTLLYPAALHYYLPAFMLAVLDDSSELIPNLYDSIEYNFSIGAECIRLLSKPQRQAANEYFRYYCMDEGVDNPDATILVIINHLQNDCQGANKALLLDEAKQMSRAFKHYKNRDYGQWSTVAL